MALQQAVVALFGQKTLPPEDEIPAVAHKLFVEVVHSMDDGSDTEITTSDLYKYLVLKSDVGISFEAVDKLFGAMDASGDGVITEDEFTRALSRMCNKMRSEREFDEQLFRNGGPDRHVVPGSCAMNSKSGTTAFRMAVIKKDEMKLLYSIFKDMNLNDDGVVSYMEFKRHMVKHKPHLAHMSASIFKSLDKKKAGGLSFQDLVKRMFPEARPTDVKILMHMADPKACLPQVKVDLTILEDIKGIFDAYDDDQSGQLDYDEFLHAMELAGFTQEESSEIFTEVDADGSGEISFEEFSFWYVAHARKQASVLQEAGQL